MARVAAITIDVSDRERSERFWCGLLGLEVVERIGEFSYLGAVAPGITLVLQRTGDRKLSKNRVHLDLAADNPETLLESVVELGGSIVREVEEAEYALTVLADPDGNEVCVSRRPSRGLDASTR